MSSPAASLPDNSGLQQSTLPFLISLFITPLRPGIHNQDRIFLTLVSFLFFLIFLIFRITWPPPRQASQEEMTHSDALRNSSLKLVFS
jgi:hypothetical protein